MQTRRYSIVKRAKKKKNKKNTRTSWYGCSSKSYRYDGGVGTYSDARVTSFIDKTYFSDFIVSAVLRSVLSFGHNDVSFRTEMIKYGNLNFNARFTSQRAIVYAYTYTRTRLGI